MDPIIKFVEPPSVQTKKRPDISPMQSPVLGAERRRFAPTPQPPKKQSSINIFDDARADPNELPRALAASFSVKHKKSKVWVVDTNMDCGPEVHDEARFRDCTREISWADLEAFAKQVDVALPPGCNLIIPALRGPIIRKWLEVVVGLRGLPPVLNFVGADEQVVKLPTRIFSRSFHSSEAPETLTLGQ